MQACFFVSFGFLANVIFGMCALSRVNIPIFFAIRRTCSLFVYLTDIYILGKTSNQMEAFGIGLITLGTLMAAVSFT